MDGLADPVSAKTGERREASPAHGSFYDAADLVYRASRPGHGGRSGERQLRAVPQFLVHPRPPGHGDRDRGVCDVPSGLGGNVDLDEVAHFYDPAARNTVHGFIVHADEVDAGEPVHQLRC